MTSVTCRQLSVSREILFSKSIKKRHVLLLVSGRRYIIGVGGSALSVLRRLAIARVMP